MITRYPEPGDISMHGIPDRTGDPLVCGERAVVDMLVTVAHNAWRQMGHTANAAPCARALSGRIMHPQPGDPVYVPDSMRGSRSPDDRRKGVGYLVVERDEWVHTDEQWAEQSHAWTDAGRGRPVEPVFYVQYGPDPGDVCRWSNASVYAIPYGDDMMRQVDEAASAIVRGEDQEMEKRA